MNSLYHITVIMFQKEQDIEFLSEKLQRAEMDIARLKVKKLSGKVLDPQELVLVGYQILCWCCKTWEHLSSHYLTSSCT